MGLAGVKEDWHPLCDELAKARPVLVYDRRGMGASRLGQPKEDEEDPDWTLDLEANDVLVLLKALGSRFAKVDILGWSMGGHILQALLLLPDVREHRQGGGGGGGVEVRGIHIEKVILAATMPKLPRGDFKPSAMEPMWVYALVDVHQYRMLTTSVHVTVWPQPTRIQSGRRNTQS